MKNVIVTGTSGMLGEAIAANLLSEGYRVIGISRRNPLSESLVTNHNYSHEVFDLQKISKIPDLVSRITSQFGPIYGLVNNSALGIDSVLATMHSKDITDLLQINLNAPIELAKHSIRGMLVQRVGRVVNITSVVAHTGYKGLSVYASTKAGLEGFTKSLAREIGKRNITVNNVAPGFMPTEMTSGLGEEQLSQIRRRTPLGRLVTSQEVADAVSFLLSEKASGITGHTLTVDGGASA